MAMIQRYLCAAVLSTVLVGCGEESDQPDLAKVTGVVTYDGQPLESGTIVFYPAAGRSASGEIAKGEILPLTTFKPEDGVPIGKHKVAIQSLDGDGKDMYAKRTSLIPEKYGSPETSGLTAEIKSGEANELKFELTK